MKFEGSVADKSWVFDLRLGSDFWSLSIQFSEAERGSFDSRKLCRPGKAGASGCQQHDSQTQGKCSLNSVYTMSCCHLLRQARRFHRRVFKYSDLLSVVKFIIVFS